MESPLIFPTWKSAMAQGILSYMLLFIFNQACYAAMKILDELWPLYINYSTFHVLQISGSELRYFLEQCLIAIFVGRALYTLVYLAVQFSHEIVAFVVRIYIFLPAISAWQYCTRSLSDKIHGWCYGNCNLKKCTRDRGGFKTQAKAFLYNLFTGKYRYQENEPEIEPEIDASTTASGDNLDSAVLNKASVYIRVPESFLKRVEDLVDMLDVAEGSANEDNEPLFDEDTGYDGDKGSSNGDEDSDSEPEEIDSNTDTDTDTECVSTTSYCKRDDDDDDDEDDDEDSSSSMAVSRGSNDATARYEKMGTGLPLGGIVGYDRRVYENDIYFRSLSGNSSRDSLDRLEALRGSLSPSSTVSSLGGGEENHSEESHSDDSEDDMSQQSERLARVVFPPLDSSQVKSMNKVSAFTDTLSETVLSALNEIPQLQSPRVQSCFVSTWRLSRRASIVEAD